jgi:transcriptional regulator with XRE-family HTH domain
MTPTVEAGKRIRETRVAKGWRQDELARRLGRTIWTISGWENGKHVVPLELQGQLADVLDLNMAELFPPPLGVARGGCGVPGCTDRDCTIKYGFCHCGCGERTPRARESSRSLALVKGEPYRFLHGHVARTGARWSNPRGYAFARENGEPLRSARLAAGWTLAEAGRKTRTSVGVVRWLETIAGTRTPLAKARRIAAAYGEPVESLFTREPTADARASDCVKTPQVERHGETAMKSASELERVAEGMGRWTEGEAADFLGVDATMVKEYEDAGLLPPAYTFAGVPFTARLHRIGDVRKLARDLWLLSRDPDGDHRRRVHSDPEWVKRWAKDRGWSRARGERLAQRVRDRNEQRARIRVKRTAEERHERWRGKWLKLREDHPDEDPNDLLGDVALSDWQDHPEDWPRERYPARQHDPSDFSDGYIRRAARDRVRTAIQKTPA